MKTDTVTITDRARAVLALDDERRAILLREENLRRELEQLAARREGVEAAIEKLWGTK